MPGVGVSETGIPDVMDLAKSFADAVNQSLTSEGEKLPLIKYDLEDDLRGKNMEKARLNRADLRFRDLRRTKLFWGRSPRL